MRDIFYTKEDDEDSEGEQYKDKVNFRGDEEEITDLREAKKKRKAEERKYRKKQHKEGKRDDYIEI